MTPAIDLSALLAMLTAGVDGARVEDSAGRTWQAHTPGWGDRLVLVRVDQDGEHERVEYRVELRAVRP